MTKPDFRLPTQKAREELSKELDLFYHPGMQDREWEIADPNEIEKYNSHYQLIDDEDKKFALIKLLSKQQQIWNKTLKTIGILYKTF